MPLEFPVPQGLTDGLTSLCKMVGTSGDVPMGRMAVLIVLPPIDDAVYCEKTVASGKVRAAALFERVPALPPKLIVPLASSASEFSVPDPVMVTLEARVPDPDAYGELRVIVPTESI